MLATPSINPPVPYLTAGKAYPVIRWLGDAFTFRNDDDGLELARVNGCHHLDGAGWKVEDGNGADG